MKKRTVVVIADEPEMIDLVKLVLERKMFKVIGVTDGREALDALRRVKPDLVLIDLLTPAADGWTIYQKIKADEELKDIPVIPVTHKAQSIDKVLGLHVWGLDDPISEIQELHCKLAPLKEEKPMFFPNEDANPVEMLPGLTRRVLAISGFMMLAEFTFEAGVEVPEHTHPNDQVGYVVSGRMRMTMGDQTLECGPGDSYHAAPGVPHAGVALEPSLVIDVFSPPREDYR